MSDRHPSGPAARWRRTFLASGGVFLALALAVKFWGVVPGEGQLYEWVVGWASPGAVVVFWWVNQLGNKWVLAPAALFVLWAVPLARRRWWLWVAVLVFAPIFEGLTKHLVGRLRPEGTALGFPSGHVTAAAAFFSLTAYLGGKATGSRQVRATLWFAAAALVLLVGIARVLLRAHWPADALGGAVLGLGCLALAAWWDARSG